MTSGLIGYSAKSAGQPSYRQHFPLQQRHQYFLLYQLPGHSVPWESHLPCHSELIATCIIVWYWLNPLLFNQEQVRMALWIMLPISGPTTLLRNFVCTLTRSKLPPEEDRDGDDIHSQDERKYFLSVKLAVHIQSQIIFLGT